MQVFVWTYIFNSFSETPRSRIAGLYGKSMFSFIRNQTLPKWLYYFVFPPVRNENPCCFTSLPSCGVISVQTLIILIQVWWYVAMF